MLAKRLVTRLAASLPPTPPCPTRNVLLPPHLVAIATGSSSSSPVGGSTAPAQHRRRVPASTSPIIPLLTGSPRPLSAFLQARGYLVRPITYPSVPRGEERVRVCLHAANTIDEVDGLADAVSEWVMRGSGGGEDELEVMRGRGQQKVAAAVVVPRARL